jgi:hypothetical protein
MDVKPHIYALIQLATLQSTASHHRSLAALVSAAAALGKKEKRGSEGTASESVSDSDSSSSGFLWFYCLEAN